jgi:flavin-dependent dehydrogenase
LAPFLAQKQMKTVYDVAIVGGGPAGSIAGTLLAQAGRKVVLVEKEPFPRFRVGESMVPPSSNVLERIGVKAKVDSAGFLPKHGGEIGSACGRRVKFLFRDGINPRWKVSYQIDRPTFDRILLEHAESAGCEIRQPLSVQRFEFSADEVCLETSAGPIVARYAIDASGRSSLIAHQFKLKQPVTELRKVAVFAYFRRPPEEEPMSLEELGFTRMIRSPEGWFWAIPMADGYCSLGIVLPVELFRSLKMSPEAMLDQWISQNPELQRFTANSQRMTPVRVINEFSYRVKSIARDRWVLAGDAAGFIDPVFSSGLNIAIYSGEQAADTLIGALAAPGRKASLFRKYEKDIQHRLDVYLKLSLAWYTQEFIEVFLHPREMFRLVPAINSVLSGNPPSRITVKLRMLLFFSLIAVQRSTHRLVPQLSLLPAESTPHLADKASA